MERARRVRITLGVAAIAACGVVASTALTIALVRVRGPERIGATKPQSSVTSSVPSQPARR
jgi:hypothetical protein